MIRSDLSEDRTCEVRRGCGANPHEPIVDPYFFGRAVGGPGDDNEKSIRGGPIAFGSGGGGRG